MYKPLFNTVLVEIDDSDAKWGKSDKSEIGADAYREGKVFDVGLLLNHKDFPQIREEVVKQTLLKFVGKQVMWNQGHEAGTVFEHEGKQYAFIHWWDIRGVKE